MLPKPAEPEPIGLVRAPAPGVSSGVGDGMSQSLTERYDDRIAGGLSCYDRVVITGTLPGVCYADGMTRYLNGQGIRIFDYPQFAMKLRGRVRDRAAS